MKTPTRRRILVVCTRRIGDVLLTTPLIRSLRKAWQDAQIDVLVLQGTEGVLVGNPDIDRVRALPKGGTRGARLRFYLSLLQSYDISLAATGSDRARFLARWAGRRCLGLWSLTDPARGRRWLPGHWVDFSETGEHAIESPLRLAKAIGVPPWREVVPPQRKAFPAITGLRQSYAVVHPWPKFSYKAWPRERWVSLGRALALDGLQVVLSGGPDVEEMAFCAGLAEEIPGALNLCGTQGFDSLAKLISLARVYIGPDTVMTHIAAATGAPTVALFGPSNPVRWGPWPARWRQPESPWPFRGSRNFGNVWLIQGEAPCVPCLMEGCERKLDSRSRCLDELPLGRVTAAIAQALALASVRGN